MFYASVQPICLCAQKSPSIVEPDIKFDLYADTCEVDDDCLNINDQNSPVNICGHTLDDGPRHTYILDDEIAHDKPKMVQIFIIMINQATEVTEY